MATNQCLAAVLVIYSEGTRFTLQLRDHSQGQLSRPLFCSNPSPTAPSCTRDGRLFGHPSTTTFSLPLRPRVQAFHIQNLKPLTTDSHGYPTIAKHLQKKYTK